ncbi:MAG: hypothetical protein AAF213_00180 [Pseudomonadota bacterium]
MSGSKFLLPLIAAGAVAAGSTAYASGPHAGVQQLFENINTQMGGHSAAIMEALTDYHNGYMNGASAADMARLERELLQTRQDALEDLNKNMQEIETTYGSQAVGQVIPHSAANHPYTNAHGLPTDVGLPSGQHAYMQQLADGINTQMGTHSDELLQALTDFHNGAMNGASPAEMARLETALRHKQKETLGDLKGHMQQIDMIDGSAGAKHATFPTDGEHTTLAAHDHPAEVVSAHPEPAEGAGGGLIKASLIGAGVLGGAAAAGAAMRQPSRSRRPVKVTLRTHKM